MSRNKEIKTVSLKNGKKIEPSRGAIADTKGYWVQVRWDLTSPEPLHLCLWSLSMRIFKLKDVTSALMGNGCSTSFLLHGVLIVCVLVHSHQQGVFSAAPTVHEELQNLLSLSYDLIWVFSCNLHSMCSALGIEICEIGYHMSPKR